MKNLAKIFFAFVLFFSTIGAKSQTLTLTQGASYSYPNAQWLTSKNVGGTVLSDIIVATDNEVKVLITDTIALGVNQWTNVASYYPGNNINGISVTTGTDNNVYVINRGKKYKQSIALTTLQNNGSGVFTITPATSYTTGFYSASHLSYKDYNNDNVKDVLVSSGTRNVVTLITGTNSPQDILIGSNVTNNGITSVNGYSVGTGDTLRDIIVSSGSGYGLAVLTQTPAGQYTTTPSFYALGEKYSCIAGGDLTGDGIIDIAASDYLNNQIVIWKGAANGTFTKLQTVACGLNPQGIIIGRLDGNTRNDIIVIEFGTGKITTFRQ